ncbi:hypothetical protein DFS34DRAFT_644130 [Phlyctochytrium arcticum]|nr:hypothetical protein DFS34DRAFT_644130 [Phlyctochytrium arcticum]
MQSAIVARQKTVDLFGEQPSAPPDIVVHDGSNSELSKRKYNPREQAAFNFLANISLESGAKDKSFTEVEPIPPLPTGISSASGFSEALQTMGTSGMLTPLGSSFYPPQFQIYSGKVLGRQRDVAASSRRTSNDIFGPSSSNNVLGQRVTLTTLNGNPLSTFSVIPYRDEKSKPKRRRTRSSKFAPHYFDKLGITISMDAVKRKKYAQSYAHLLEPALSLEPKCPDNSVYHPFFLDDPELRTGKHRTVITLPCFMGSIMQYSKPSDIKKELNVHFRDTHPTVDTTLTLTQIRRLKERLLKVAEQQDLELSSVAAAYVYFEKLVLKNMVSKETRRLVAAVCLFLAAKVNDPKELNYTKLLEAMDKALDVSPKDVMANEFAIYAALEFTLFLPLWEVMPHLERIVVAASSHNTIEDYLENRTFYMHTFST